MSKKKSENSEKKTEEETEEPRVRQREVTMREGEVIGHFAEFKEGKTRDFINVDQDTGKKYKEGTITMPPRIKGGIFVLFGDRRIPINCRDTEDDLDAGVSAAEVSIDAKKKVLDKTAKVYPFGQVFRFRETRYLDNNWKQYQIIGPKE